VVRRAHQFGVGNALQGKHLPIGIGQDLLVLPSCPHVTSIGDDT
jgi:hypothetical protein